MRRVHRRNRADLRRLRRPAHHYGQPVNAPSEPSGGKPLVHRHVQYHGSIAEARGQIFCLVGLCTCDDCTREDWPLSELAQMDGYHLLHVRDESFTVVPDERDYLPGPWVTVQTVGKPDVLGP
ncbi:hypothetical protein FDG2_1452 [Candidatus Protofrankia californiensis]|uniref:Uncharacterized protein n=1 Tax=Candidatus Protofrankia californiensis TaxID=1839754 RepID=A0A1C3NVM1_9ACTN|nr:hypothetical protein FDG2_1452 [Candidatus Protofrankia californiensis]